jgi:hypothetical protein
VKVERNWSQIILLTLQKATGKTIAYLSLIFHFAGNYLPMGVILMKLNIFIFRFYAGL